MKGRTLPAKPAGENLRVFDFQKRQLKTKRNVEKTEKQKPRILLQSPSATAPSRREPMSWCDFRLGAQRKNTKSGFSQFSKPKGCTFKTKDFRHCFFFAPQSDTDRLPSFKEGSCRRRRLRGVGVRKKADFEPRSRTASDCAEGYSAAAQFFTMSLPPGGRCHA